MIRPFNDKLIVEILNEETKTDSGIIINTEKNVIQKAKVLAVSKKVEEDENVQAGATVLVDVTRCEKFVVPGVDSAYSIDIKHVIGEIE